MFLFERLDTERCLEKRILYTGDFRLDDARTCLRSLASLRPLHGPDPAAPLRIHELYLDTTFCSPAFPLNSNLGRNDITQKNYFREN